MCQKWQLGIILIKLLNSDVDSLTFKMDYITLKGMKLLAGWLFKSVDRTFT